ncbi:hypothetical protein [Helicobacter sp. MIT 05-5294]|uniref:hypothetical protein n=1 Tax=Helicobacter sp. MIT 05-5294 TaxID=1548150 RepID=UPI0010FE7DF2|nr:hypothetical protein [Helicobacter sp. MIT 05-5294]TLD87316.1 hypothetical protein LS69_004680 [Helicobacter sp. MIT 05-5294]
MVGTFWRCGRSTSCAAKCQTHDELGIYAFCGFGGMWQSEIFTKPPHCHDVGLSLSYFILCCAVFAQTRALAWNFFWIF